jgi:aspartate carbamoyltransferase catalytic subunit
MNTRSLISITDLDRAGIEAILNDAALFAEKGIPFEFSDRAMIVASLFFEASTRTRLSFETAANRLGARVVGFDSPENTSFSQKGESLEDTIRMIDAYADVIVIRHPETSALQIAADVATHPVVNAGNGAGEHPTQTLIDLYTMKQLFGKIDGLTVAIVGDLQFGRVPHSLAQALTQFDDVKQIWVAPSQLPMPEHVRTAVEATGAHIEMTTDIQHALNTADVVYMTRVQKERFEDSAEYEALKDTYILTPELLATAKPTMKILHALPRLYELPTTVDATPHAAYFEQAANAVVVRAALMRSILNA